MRRFALVLPAGVLLMLSSAALATTRDSTPQPNRLFDSIQQEPVPGANPKKITMGTIVEGNIFACSKWSSFEKILAAEKQGKNALAVYREEDSCDSMYMKVRLGGFLQSYTMHDGRVYDIYKVKSTGSLFVAIPRQ